MILPPTSTHLPMKNVPEIEFYHCAPASQTLCLHGASVSFCFSPDSVLQQFFSQDNSLIWKENASFPVTKSLLIDFGVKNNIHCKMLARYLFYLCWRSHRGLILVSWSDIARRLHSSHGQTNASSQGWHNGFSQWWTMRPSKCLRTWLFLASANPVVALPLWLNMRRFQVVSKSWSLSEQRNQISKPNFNGSRHISISYASRQAELYQTFFPWFGVVHFT